MKAISIRQPWAWLIIRPDITDQVKRAAMALMGELKDIENRDWITYYRGPVLVHASKGTTQAEWNDGCWALSEFIGPEAWKVVPPIGQLDRGGFIGKTNITDCVTTSPSKWFQGEYGFKLANSQPLPLLPYRGQLSVFEVPDSILPPEYRR